MENSSLSAEQILHIPDGHGGKIAIPVRSRVPLRNIPGGQERAENNDNIPNNPNPPGKADPAAQSRSPSGMTLPKPQTCLFQEPCPKGKLGGPFASQKTTKHKRGKQIPCSPWLPGWHFHWNRNPGMALLPSPPPQPRGNRVGLIRKARAA